MLGHLRAAVGHLATHIETTSGRVESYLSTPLPQDEQKEDES